MKIERLIGARFAKQMDRSDGIDCRYVCMSASVMDLQNKTIVNDKRPVNLLDIKTNFF